jgi:hypothetical protein
MCDQVTTLSLPDEWRGDEGSLNEWFGNVNRNMKRESRSGKQYWISDRDEAPGETEFLQKLRDVRQIRRARTTQIR